mmetsp:Transcript_1051/g.3207  ORF Transcript_1051/g.3207 Transcript_1051/m.3207 type:complete len:282 (+) Transcript_1051:598-1443(+)
MSCAIRRTSLASSAVTASPPAARSDSSTASNIFASSGGKFFVSNRPLFAEKPKCDVCDTDRTPEMPESPSLSLSCLDFRPRRNVLNNDFLPDPLDEDGDEAAVGEARDGDEVGVFDLLSTNACCAAIIRRMASASASSEKPEAELSRRPARAASCAAAPFSLPLSPPGRTFSKQGGHTSSTCPSLSTTLCRARAPHFAHTFFAFFDDEVGSEVSGAPGAADAAAGGAGAAGVFGPRGVKTLALAPDGGPPGGTGGGPPVVVGVDTLGGAGGAGRGDTAGEW